MTEKAKPALILIFLSGVAFFLSLALWSSGILDGFELKAYDFFSRTLNPPAGTGDIVIVKIDQQSLDSLSREGIQWPWPRQIYAPMVEYLSEADALFVDVLFLEPSSYGVEDDRIFAEAAGKASNVYLALSLTTERKDLGKNDREFIERIAIGEEISGVPTFQSANMPIAPLQSSARGAGNVTIAPDRDGVYRRTPLFFRMGSHTIPHFVLGYLIDRKEATIIEGTLYSRGMRVPLKEGRMLLRYSGNPELFREISAVDVLVSHRDCASSRVPVYKKEFFRGKKVFIGMTAAGLYDLKPTSVSPVTTGVFIHATALENMLNRNFLKPVNSFYVAVFMLLISFFICYLVLRFHSLIVNLSVFSVSLLLSLAVPAVLFRVAFYMDIIPPSLALVLGFIISATYSYAAEGKERRYVRRVFSQYMDEKIVEYILRNPEVIKPGGQKRRVTVFFADIAGFTPMAEKLPPEETAAILHAVLNAFTEVIIANGGVIDKYIGDCIMAFWGAPVETDKDESLACASALRCIDALRDINEGFRSRGIPEISVRIGIHSGDAIVGNLGSDRLFDYTVVGDTVNIASRLEAANKLFRTGITVSGETVRNVGDSFLMRDLGLLGVKGREMPVGIFELISAQEGSRGDLKNVLDRFGLGTSLFREGRWEEARKVFDEVLGEMPGDGPAEFYRKRCDELLANFPLTDDWNVIKMIEK